MFMSGDTHYLSLNDLVMLIAFFAISIVPSCEIDYLCSFGVDVSSDIGTC